MEETLLQRTIEFIKQRFQNDSSGHDYYHTMRVFHTATRIASTENANLLLVQMAALLHDVDDRKLFETGTELNGARRFMLEVSLSSEITVAVCSIIKEVSFKGTDSCKPSSIEGMIVQDADRLDAIGAIGIARTFAYGGSKGRKLHDPEDQPNLNMNAEVYYNNIGTSINHFYEKLLTLKDLINTAEGKRIAEERHNYMVSFLEEFLAEWDGRI
jgi:uncharacterized protein